MINPQQEKGYMVRLLRDDFPQIIENWRRMSEYFREKSECKLDIQYSGAESGLDLFYCGEPHSPLLIYIHGGYWQSGDKSIYSFIAKPFVERGVDVAILGYPLCPTLSMTQLSHSVMNAIAWLYSNAKMLGISASRINLCGHSAGGHLAGIAIATNWPSYASNLPQDLVKSVISISGLYQLQPLLKTSINEALKMGKAEAKALSPLGMRPVRKVPALVSLGGAETRQFHWQADEYIAYLRAQDVEVEKIVEPGVDHFDVINQFSKPDSIIFQKVKEWLR